IPDDRKDDIIENVEAGARGWRAYIGSVLTPIGVLVVLAAVSGIFLFFGNMLFGGQASFRQVLSMYAHAGVIAVPASVVKVPLILAQQSLRVQTNLALFLSADAEQSLLYRLLAKFDIFTIWEVILLIIGLAAIYRFSNGRASAIVLTLWGLWIAVSLALGSVFQGFGFA
ncbi:MAG: YIP1 family protein, partial [bacterium]